MSGAQHGTECVNTSQHVEKPYAPQSRGYLLHIGAQGGQAEKFCDLIKPLARQSVPTMLHKFY